MKCPNCGFESNEKFCKMCGTKIPDVQAPENNNSYINFNQNIANDFQQTGAVPPFAPADNAFGQQTPNGIPAPGQYPNANPNPLPQPGQNPNANPSPLPQPGQYPNANPSPFPQPGQYPNANPSPFPQPPEVPQNNNNPKSKKVLTVVISCVVVLILIAGIVINIVSSNVNKKSIFDNLSIFDDDYIYDDIDYGDILSSDETAVMPNSKLKILSYECSELDTDNNYDSQYYKNCKDLAIKCEFMSTADGEFYITESDFSLFPNDKPNLYCQILYPDDNYYYIDFDVDAGETKSFTIHYAVPQDSDTFTLQFYTYFYDSNDGIIEYQNSCQFEIKSEE